MSQSPGRDKGKILALEPVWHHGLSGLVKDKYRFTCYYRQLNY